MRITLDKWNKGRNKLFEYNEMTGMLVNSSHTMALIPFTDEAKTHLLLTEGVVIDEGSNVLGALNKTTYTPVGSVGCGIARLKNNKADLIRIGNSSFDPSLVRLVLKHYKRQKDTIHIFGNPKEDSPIKILTPCLDWLVYIAPRVDKNDSTLLALDHFDYGVLV